MKTFVIGDIHGAHKALLQLLARSGFNREEDRLIFLGDYIDGWSDSVKILRFLAELKASSDRHIFLSGNHDTWLLHWMTTGEADAVWKNNGGLGVIQQMKDENAVSDPNILHFLKDLKPYFVEDIRLFALAGLHSEEGVQHDSERYHFWDRSFWENIFANDPKTVQKALSLYDEIYIGHTPTIYFRDENGAKFSTPILRSNVMNLDTGAGWGEKLSCVNLQTKEVFQSDRTAELYPDEIGR